MASRVVVSEPTPWWVHIYIGFWGGLVGAVVSVLGWIVFSILLFPFALTGLFILLHEASMASWLAPIALGLINGAHIGILTDSPGKGMLWGMVLGVIVGPTVAFMVTEMLVKEYSVTTFFMKILSYMFALGVSSIGAGAMSGQMAVKFHARMLQRYRKLRSTPKAKDSQDSKPETA